MEKLDDSYKARGLRKQLIRVLVEKGIVQPNLLEAIGKVPRHFFLDKIFLEHAYVDKAFPIGEGQTISQPYTVAFQTELLVVQPNKKILEIGTGSGYQAAILGELSDHVYTIEILEPLGIRAIELLKILGYTNVNTKIGDGYLGWEEYAPFDAIIVTCAPSDIPDPLKKQLKEGGRMIIPIGGRTSQRLILLEKVKGKMRERTVLDVLFVPMIDKSGKKY